MLNEDLLDPKDLEIARLQHTIEKFKKYDEQRRRYYSSILLKLGELESYVQELEEENRNETITKLREKVKNQKEEIVHLNKVITVNKYHLFDDNYTLTAATNTIEMEALKKKNRALLKRNKDLQETISELVYKLNRE